MIYIKIKSMTFNEENNEIEHEIILNISEEEILGYDYKLNIEWNFDIKIRDDSWDSFPLYELKDNKIIAFDYIKYQYFRDTKRRSKLSSKINDMYNPPAEAKILRKTLKKILDHLEITDEGFEKYNMKVEDIINKNPKS